MCGRSYPPSNTRLIWATASAARPAISASESVLKGWVMTTGVSPSIPKACRCTWASCKNSWVMMTAVGIPSVSKATASCVQHEVQEPQSPMAVITMSFSATIWAIISGEAVREKLSLV